MGPSRTISEPTRQRVLQRSRELNYQPNLIARSLVTRRTFTIGLLLPDFTHPFFAQIAKSVAQTMRSKGGMLRNARIRSRQVAGVSAGLG